MCLKFKLKYFMKDLIPFSQLGVAFEYQRGLSGKLQLLQGELFVRKSSSGKSGFVALHRGCLRHWQSPSDKHKQVVKTLLAVCGIYQSQLCLSVGNCQSETTIH